ncbi:MAG: hypothetical protein ACOC56_00025 [Atribacterota bacterium]
MKSKENIFKIPDVLFYCTSIIWLIFILSKYFKYHGFNINALFMFDIPDNIVFTEIIKLSLEYLYSVVLFIGIVAGVYYLGKKTLTILGYIKTVKFNNIDETIFSIGLGYGLLALFTLFLGKMGLLYETVVFPIWFILSFFGIKEIIKTVNWGKNKVLKLDWRYSILFYFLIIVIIFNFIMCFTPELFYDALVYHIGIPKFYKVYHKIIPTPFVHAGHFPLNTSMLYLWGIMLKDEMVAKLINFSFGGLIILHAFAFCKKYFNSTRMGLISGIIFYLTPLVAVKLWATNSDIGLTYFTTLALYAGVNYFYCDSKKAANVWVILSGIFTGLLLGAKYTGIFFAFAISLIIVKKNFRKIFLWSITGFLLFSPWLIRNYVSTGNPVYPFLTGVFDEKDMFEIKFGGSGYGKKFFSNPLKGGKGIKQIKKIFIYPFNVSIKGGGNTKPFRSIEYYGVGIHYLAFLILLLFITDKDKKYLKPGIYFAVVSYMFWSLFANSMRYYMPGLFILGAGSSYFIVKADKKNKTFGTVLITIFSIIAVSNFLLILPVARTVYQPGKSLLDKEFREKLIANTRPGLPYPSYSAYKYINKNLSEDAKVLIFGEAKTFYINRKFIKGEAKSLTPIIEFLRKSSSAQDFYKLLVNKYNITHLLVNQKEALRTTGFGTLYFSKRDIEKLDEFWRDHINLIYENNSKKLFIYEIKEKKDPDSYCKNTIKQVFMIDYYRKIEKKVREKKWDEVTSMCSEYLEIVPEDDYVLYLKSMAEYNLGFKDRAVNLIKKAIKIKPDKRYKRALKKMLKENKK